MHIQPPATLAFRVAALNKARLDNRWGSLLSSMLFSSFNINPAIDVQCRPSGASA